MLTKEKLKQIKIDAMDIETVELKTVGEKICVKKLTMGDTMRFRGLSDEDASMQMVMLGVVKPDGKPFFDNIKEIEDLPMDMVAEMMEAVAVHNNESAVEDQAKKS